MSFRELVNEMDAQVLDDLGDEGLIEGRPVTGFFAAPWLEPKLGRLNTGLREPEFTIRVEDAVDVEQRQTVVMDLPQQDGGGTYTIVELKPDGTGWVALILRGV